MKPAIRFLALSLFLTLSMADAEATWRSRWGGWWRPRPTQPYTPPSRPTNPGGGGSNSGGGGGGGGTPAVPEPGTVILMGTGIAAIAAIRYRRRKTDDE